MLCYIFFSVLWIVPHGISELKPRTKAGVQVSYKRQIKKEWDKETVMDTGPTPETLFLNYVPYVYFPALIKIFAPQPTK